VLVQRQKDRSVWRVEEPGRIWFAKCGRTRKRRREIEREVENACALAESNFGARVIAAGRWGSATWIVTADAGDLLRGRMLDADRRRPLLTAAAAFIRRFHEAGFAAPDMTHEHLRFRDDGIVLIDVARLERHGGAAPVSSIARDLARLLFSWEMGIRDLSRIEAVRLVRDATATSGAPARRLWARIEREVDRLRRRTRWRHAHTSMEPEYYRLHGSLSGCDERPSPSSWFGFVTCDRGMEVVRTLPDRENRTLGRGPDGKPLFFVKVFPPTKQGWSPAMRELAAIDLFQRAGILVNRVAAYAEDVDKGSMVAVTAARGEPLDDLLRRGVSVAERRALAVETARIWRRMRECGLRHRDAYPCHVFAAPWASVGVPPSGGSSIASGKANDPAEAGTPTEGRRHELRLIDLTRAGKAPFPKERWFVKDAAALWHGLPKPPVTRTDAVRWLREYFRIGRLDARAKRFARRVASKEARIAARQKRKSKR
jgi:hypothetical protein